MGIVINYVLFQADKDTLCRCRTATSLPSPLNVHGARHVHYGDISKGHNVILSSLSVVRSQVCDKGLIRSVF